MRSDEDVKRYVEDELKWDPNVDSTDIAVAARNGIVTLAGFVRSLADKFVAESAAKRVAGVVGLANDLEVRLPGADKRPDPEIARDVVAEVKSWLPDAWQQRQTSRQGRLGDPRRRSRVELSAGLCGTSSSLDWRDQGHQQFDPPTPAGSSRRDKTRDRGSVSTQCADRCRSGHGRCEWR
jgi:hypothetical protein